jgi:hypothetical protein
MSLHTTRYTAIVDSLRKNDTSEETKHTVALVRQLPADVNFGVNAECLRLAWLQMCKKLDHHSVAMLNHSKFTVFIYYLLLYLLIYRWLILRRFRNGNYALLNLSNGSVLIIRSQVWTKYMSIYTKS